MRKSVPRDNIEMIDTISWMSLVLAEKTYHQAKTFRLHLNLPI